MSSSNAPSGTEEVTPDDVGPPGKFDAEPATRKSKRWIFVTLGLFLAITASVAIGVWQLKDFFSTMAASRAQKAERERAESAIPRPKKLFDTTAALPTEFGKPKEELITAPVPLAPTAQPMAAVPMAPPVTYSMVVGDLSKTPAQPAAATPPLNTAPARARTVQELAKRTQGPVTATAQSQAAALGNRSLLVARGAFIPCTLLTQLNSNVPGPVSCITSQDIFSDDGKVLLIEKASKIEGEYKATLKNGDTRINVLWNRIRTPNGVVVDVDSPASDAVGTIGINGEIDNHWFERIGAAVLLSLVDDGIKLQTAREGAQSAGSTTQPFQATTGTTKSIAEKVLDSTINIAPTLTKNRGERLMVFVNRDLWFDQVYELVQK